MTNPNLNPTPAYTKASVTSKDGTVIGYRQLGSGPGLILVHGGMMSSHNFMKLASFLADAFTLYLPDRRGRGLSGPHGNNFGIAREVEDMQALITHTGATNIFGLSSGALVTMQTALQTPSLHNVSLYEPPLGLNGRPSLLGWVPRYEEELAQGDLAGAMISVVKGTDDSLFARLPRFVTERLIRAALKQDATEIKVDEPSLAALIPTMHYDQMLVKEMAGSLGNFRALPAEVLLLGGSQSIGYLKEAVDALTITLPHVSRVTLQGVGHTAADNGGQPQRVAEELRFFFS
jgi:pimeloyl-ACP methyl ester carboxylesterase